MQENQIKVYIVYWRSKQRQIGHVAHVCASEEIAQSWRATLQKQTTLLTYYIEEHIVLLAAPDVS